MSAPTSTRRERLEQRRATASRRAGRRRRAARRRRLIRLGAAAAVAAVLVVVAALASSSHGTANRATPASPASSRPRCSRDSPSTTACSATRRRRSRSRSTSTCSARLRAGVDHDASRGRAQLRPHGEGRLAVRTLHFIGPDSERAARVAAGAEQQGRLLPLPRRVFYAQQGTENTGYVTDAFLRRVAAAAGVDAGRGARAGRLRLRHGAARARRRRRDAARRLRHADARRVARRRSARISSPPTRSTRSRWRAR